MPKMIDVAEKKRKQEAIAKRQRELSLERRGYSHEDAVAVVEGLSAAVDIGRALEIAKLVGTSNAADLDTTRRQGLAKIESVIAIVQKYEPGRSDIGQALVNTFRSERGL